MTNILARFVRAGQRITVFGYAAGHFGIDGGQGMHTGIVTDVVRGMQLIDLSAPLEDDGSTRGDAHYDGVRFTFDDGHVVDVVSHARAMFIDGPPPSDEEITETIAEDEALNESIEDMEAEGVFGLIGVHVGPDEAEQPVVVVHLPEFDDVVDQADAVEPEQAEAFAMRLLKVAAEVRVLRQMIAEHDEHCDHDHGHDHGD